jgi:inner membrane protein
VVAARGALDVVPTIITHGIVGATLGAVSRPRPARRLLVAAAICATLPDLDVVTFRLGIPYADMLGHRGLSHSIVAAMVVATVVAGVFHFNNDRLLSRSVVWTVLFVATLSHGLLDAMTDGGLGVAFFAPFSGHRYFFPWRPIAVSPIGVRFFSTRGLAVLWSEMVWVWIPTLGVAALAWYRDRRRV